VKQPAVSRFRHPAETNVTTTKENDMLKKPRNQDGFLITIELIFLATLLIGILVIGGAALAPKLISELADVGAAVGSLNQSYTLTGTDVGHPNDPNHPTDTATWAGSGYVDHLDSCDIRGCDSGVRFCQSPTPEANGV
jgi:hypothetical protein